MIDRLDRGHAPSLAPGWPLGGAHRDPLLRDAVHLDASILGVPADMVDDALVRHARELGSPATVIPADGAGPTGNAAGTSRVAGRRRATTAPEVPPNDLEPPTTGHPTASRPGTSPGIAPETRRPKGSTPGNHLRL